MSSGCPHPRSSTPGGRRRATSRASDPRPVATDPQPAIGEESSGYAPPVLDLIAAACLVALSVWVMIESARMEVPDALATAPGLLPFLTAASLCVMAIALGWQALWRRRGAAALEGEAPGAAELWRTLTLAAVIGCYLL